MEARPRRLRLQRRYSGLLSQLKPERTPFTGGANLHGLCTLARSRSPSNINWPGLGKTHATWIFTLPIPRRTLYRESKAPVSRSKIHEHVAIALAQNDSKTTALPRPPALGDTLRTVNGLPTNTPSERFRIWLEDRHLWSGAWGKLRSKHSDSPNLVQNSL